MTAVRFDVEDDDGRIREITGAASVGREWCEGRWYRDVEWDRDAWLIDDAEANQNAVESLLAQSGQTLRDFEPVAVEAADEAEREHAISRAGDSYQGSYHGKGRWW